ncbi:hypothetical protein [Neobacillus drentensis]|uniref:hypothetical protein n=1 Tax=Neobacillus drentensis TaxID=220684 RepID=UPI002FFE25AA
MIGERSDSRRKLKGYMFEVVILKLIESNGFRFINIFDQKIREDRNRFIEFRGRGGWHQIDCPCDYENIIPFMNPLRLLGEVKYYADPISKDHIREFIGVIKDIQENYFVPDNYHGSFHRYTEIGVFFAANGFQIEAERLAYAHNIKTISYKNNYIIEQIKTIIEQLEANYLSVNCISRGNLNDFQNMFSELLNQGDIRRFSHRFNPSNGFDFIIYMLLEFFNNINSSFIANTSGGAFLHFLSNDSFPSHLFQRTDKGSCRVYIDTNPFGGTAYYLTFVEDVEERKFYFTPPMALRNAAYFGASALLDAKEELLKTIHLSINLNGINRNLVLELDTDWLNAIRRDA